MVWLRTFPGRVSKFEGSPFGFSAIAELDDEWPGSIEAS